MSRISRVVWVLLAFVGSSLGAPQAQGASLDALISQVWGTPNATTGTPIVGGEINTESKQQSANIDNDDDCECVPYYQCQNNTITTEGIGLIDIRSSFDNPTRRNRPSFGGRSYSLKGTCDNYLDICCKLPNVLTPDNKVTPKPPVRTGCGQRNVDGVGFRITGQSDNEAQFGEFPWMVAILKSEAIGANGEKLNVYQCGGALIHPRAVLTAAHCVNGKQASDLKVRAGEWDTQTRNEIFPHQDRDVETVVVHERFHSGALYNDFALLILKEAVVIGENVDVVCLPGHNDVFDGARCQASGWGRDIFGKEGHYQVILKRVELPVVSHAACQVSLRTTRLGKYFVLNETFICAGGESGKDTCKGDGGSPLVCPLKNDPTRYAQAGIVSWGIGCGDNQIPGVYANVASARHWIDEQMVFNNLDINVYQP